MPYEIVMPQLGLTMTEGSVSAWLKNPGDRVEKGEALFTVETDKVEMEVESAAAGYLAAVYLEPKTIVPTGAVIAVLADRQEEIAAVAEEHRPRGAAQTAAAAVATAPVPLVGTEAAPAEGAFPVSPRARKLAAELGVDLATVKPAKGTRIVEEDVRRFHAAGAASKPAAPPPERAAGARAIVAERLSRSFREAPHFYLTVDVNAVALVDFREKLKQAGGGAGAKLTYTDLMLKAIAMAVGEQPALNAYWSAGGIVPRDSVDLAFAAQGDQTLFVPVIRNAAALTLFEISRRRAELAEKARTGRLSLADMEGGSVTLSNLGAFGVDWFQAVLNPPQSLIVAAGRIAKRPVVVGDRVEACPTLALTASIDHRVLDGVAGARFLGRMKSLLENPVVMLL